MIKTSPSNALEAQDKSRAAAIRSYEPEEFDADTTEERPVALLAERRRQFLAGLAGQQTDSMPQG